MFSLFMQEEKGTIEHKGDSIQLDISFDTVLKLIDLSKQDIFENYEKLIIMYQLLVEDYEQYQHDITDMETIVKKAVVYLINTDEETSNEQIFDFEEDGARIYASFLKCYDIDLKKEQGKMDWFTFQSLLNSLTEDTPFTKAIGYRVMDIPPVSKIGIDEHRRLTKLKKSYQLETQKEKDNRHLLAMMEQRKNKILEDTNKRSV